MKKTVLLVLLSLNAVAQLGGGTLMAASPAKAAVDIFHVAATPEAMRLLPIIGGAVLGYAMLSGICLLWVLRGRRAGFELARAFGLAMIGIGIIMLVTGTSAGAIDVLKGSLIAAAAWWAGSDVPDPTMASVDRVRVP
jgi:hypothetical protein